MFFEGYSFRNDHDLIFFSRKAYQKWRTFCCSINCLLISSIYNHQTPLRIFPSNCCKLVQRLQHRQSFFPFYRKKLHDDFSIRLTGKLKMAQILILELRMIGDDSIVDEKDFAFLIEMRMRVAIDSFTTGGPTGVGDSTCCNSSLGHDLINHFIYAACLLQTVLGVFDESAFVSFLAGERKDSGTVVSSVFEELNALA